MARCHGLVVKADGSWPRGRGFKPRHRILYGCKQFTLHLQLKIKVAKWGTQKKKKNFFLKSLNSYIGLDTINIISDHIQQLFIYSPVEKYVHFLEVDFLWCRKSLESRNTQITNIFVVLKILITFRKLSYKQTYFFN